MNIKSISGYIAVLTLSFLLYATKPANAGAFVGRRLLPLVVDLDTLEVSVYAVRNENDKEWFPRAEGGLSAFGSHGGLLYVAGSNSDFRTFRLDPQSHRFSGTRAESSPDWHYGSTGGSLAAYHGCLYYAGQKRWLRYDLGSARTEILVASPRSLPDFGSGGAWELAVSNTAGLVAWLNGKLYRVDTEPETGD